MVTPGRHEFLYFFAIGAQTLSGFFSADSTKCTPPQQAAGQFTGSGFSLVREWRDEQ